MPSRIDPKRLLGQAVAYALFGAFIGVFAASPVYRHRDPAMAEIRLVFEHAGQRVAECRRRSAAEMAEMAANMRKALDCPRERAPLRVELMVDGEVLYRAIEHAAGIASDGPSTVYRRLTVAPGTRHIVVGLREQAGEGPFDYRAERTVTLKAAQALLIGFEEEKGGFIFLE